MDKHIKCKKELKIVLKGKPVADSRPRARLIGKMIKFYDSKALEKKEIKRKLKKILEEKYGSIELINTPKNKFKLSDITFIETEYKFYYKLPVNVNNNCKNLAKEEQLRNITKVDVDNLIKLYNDCLHGIIYDDDCLVTASSGEKLYTLNDEDERVEIIIKFFKYIL